MPGCAIVGCSNRPSGKNNTPSDTPLRFYCIPTVRLNEDETTRQLSEERRRLWKAAVNRKDIRSEDEWNRTLVCSRHFVDGVKAYLYQRNSPSWLPTLHLGYTTTSTVARDRYARLQKRNRCVNVNVQRKKRRTVTNESTTPASGDSDNDKQKKRRAVTNKSTTPVSGDSDNDKQKKRRTVTNEITNSACGDSDNDKQKKRRTVTNKSTAPACDDNDRHPGDNLENECSFFGFNAGPTNSVGDEDTSYVSAGNDVTVHTGTNICTQTGLTGKPAELFEEDHPDWVPSLYMGHELEMDQNKGTKRKRKIKPSKDRRKQSKNSKDYNTQYVKTLEDKLLQYRQKFQSFESEIKDLKEKLNCCMFTFTEESFQDNDAKVKFYTGLPNFVTLMSLLRFLSPHISNGTGTVTTKFQKLLMVLMRLHLNLPVQLLADVFQVSDSTVSIIFEQFIDIMYILMKPVITWPDRKTLKANVPCEIVQQFGKEVMIIINSFEICIEMPSNPLTRAEILSSNEKQNTLKYLIGITPQGTVSFVTKGWGGKTSSKYLTENCSLLDNLDPGDLIVADWGLESAGLVCAEVTVSEFSGQKQLCAFLAEPAKTVQVRNFMERVVGKIMQKYSILNSSIPFTFLNTAEGENTSTLDKVVLVCCALVNMCPSQVSFDEDKVNLN